MNFFIHHNLEYDLPHSESQSSIAVADPGGIVRFRTKPPFSAQYLPNLQPQLNSPQTGTMELHRETISRLLRDQLNQNWGGPSIEHAQYLAGFSNKRTQQPADRAFVRLH